MATLRGMSALPHDFWAGFALDPRHPAHAGLRAADEDREHVHRLLSEAYARGQLGPEEHDERVDFVAGARTLGELPPVVEDLVMRSPVRLPPPIPPQQLRAQAELFVQARTRSQWVSAGFAALVASVVGIAGGGAVLLTALVLLTLLLGTRALRTQVRRDELVARQERRLDFQARDRIERQQRQVRRRQRRAEAMQQVGPWAEQELRRRLGPHARRRG